MKEASLVTGKVFTKLFFSFVVVLFLGMVVLDFSLRQVMEHSLRAQADDSLVAEARLVAAHLVRTGTTDPATNDPPGCRRCRG
jgi:sensor histidine kinase regulating citrate/malate metabolism